MPWSDWQDPWAMPFFVSPTNWPFHTRDEQVNVSDTSELWQDYANAARDELPVVSAEVDFRSSVWANTRSNGSSVRVAAGYTGANILGSGVDDTLNSSLPDPLDGLTFGVDYDEIPGWDGSNPLQPSPYVEYASADTAFAQWGDIDISLTIRIQWALDQGSDSTFEIPTSAPFTLWATAPDSSQEVGTEPERYSRPWLTYEDGQVLLHYDFPTTPVITIPGTTQLYSQTFTVPLSDWDDPDVGLVMMPRILDAAVDVPGPTPGTFQADGLDTRWSWGVVPPSTATSDDPPPLIPTSTIYYTTSAWRYWIPDPKWHTFGGNFTTFGSGSLHIKTPGRGFVDVVDGPG